MITKKDLIERIKIGLVPVIAATMFMTNTVNAEEFTVKNNPQRRMIEVHENGKYQFDWKQSTGNEQLDSFTIMHGNDELRFRIENNKFNKTYDCNNLSNPNVHYNKDKSSEILQARFICETLPRIISMYENKKLEKQLSKLTDSLNKTYENIQNQIEYYNRLDDKILNLK